MKIPNLVVGGPILKDVESSLYSNDAFLVFHRNKKKFPWKYYYAFHVFHATV